MCTNIDVTLSIWAHYYDVPVIPNVLVRTKEVHVLLRGTGYIWG